MKPEIYFYQDEAVRKIRKCYDLEMLYLINGLLQEV